MRTVLRRVFIFALAMGLVAPQAVFCLAPTSPFIQREFRLNHPEGRYNFEPVSGINHHEQYRLIDKTAGSEMLVDPVGFKIVSFKTQGVENVNYSDDYGPNGISVEFPFAGRIQGGEFMREGEKRVLEKNEQGEQNAIGGLVRDKAFQVEKIEADEEGIFIRGYFETSFLPQMQQQFGHARLTLTYRLKGNRILLDSVVSNLEDKDLPVFFRYHPWLKVQTGRAKLRRLQARQMYADETKMPEFTTDIPGDWNPAEQEIALPKNADHTFVGLQPDPDGYWTIEAHAGDRTIRMRGQAHAFANAGIWDTWGGNLSIEPGAIPNAVHRNAPWVRAKEEIKGRLVIEIKDIRPPLFGYLKPKESKEISGDGALRVWVGKKLSIIDPKAMPASQELSDALGANLRIEKLDNGNVKLTSLDKLNVAKIYFETGTSEEIREAIIAKNKEIFREPELFKPVPTGPVEKVFLDGERVRVAYKGPIQVWLGASARVELRNAEDLLALNPALRSGIDSRFAYYLVNPDDPRKAIGIGRVGDYFELGQRNADILNALDAGVATGAIYARIAWMGGDDFYLESHAYKETALRLGWTDAMRVEQNVATVLSLKPQAWNFIAGLPRNHYETTALFNTFGQVFADASPGLRSFTLNISLSGGGDAFVCKAIPQAAGQIQILPVMVLTRTAQALQEQGHFNALAHVLNQVPGGPATKLEVFDATTASL